MTLLFRLLLLSLLAVGFSACGDNDPEQPVDAPDGLGAFGVGHTSFTPVDASRDDRSLLVDVWYPVDGEDVRDSPRTTYELAAGIGLDSEVAVDGLLVSARQDQTLLVFSHGYGGINTQSVELMEARWPATGSSSRRPSTPATRRPRLRTNSMWPPPIACRTSPS